MHLDLFWHTYNYAAHLLQEQLNVASKVLKIKANLEVSPSDDERKWAIRVDYPHAKITVQIFLTFVHSSIDRSKSFFCKCMSKNVSVAAIISCFHNNFKFEYHYMMRHLKTLTFHSRTNKRKLSKYIGRTIHCMWGGKTISLRPIWY